MFNTGLTHEQICCAVLGAVEALAACVLMSVVTEPWQVLCCGIVGTLGVAVMAYALGGE